MQKVTLRLDCNYSIKPHYIAILSALFSLLILGSCGVRTSSLAPTTEWAYRWLKRIPCQAPCWEGVTTGKTTASEAVGILRQNPLIRSAEMITSSIAPTFSEVDWAWVDDQIGGRAFYNAQTFPHTINSVQVNYPISFSLQDVMTAYGNPSHIIATASRGTFTGESDPQHIVYGLRIVYMNDGFFLSADGGGDGKPHLTNTLQVGNPTFFPPNENSFTSLYTLNPPEQLVPWQGFKDFEFYCRDREAGRVCNAPYRLPFSYWFWFTLAGIVVITGIWTARRWRKINSPRKGVG